MISLSEIKIKYSLDIITIDILLYNKSLLLYMQYQCNIELKSNMFLEFYHFVDQLQKTMNDIMYIFCRIAWCHCNAL